MKKRLLAGDLFVFVTVLALAFSIHLVSRKDGANSVGVYYNNALFKTLSLDSDITFSPDGGHTEITVENNTAFVSFSDCSDKICMNTSPITKKSSGIIVCLPNKVALISEAKSKIDGVAQ